MKPPTLLFILLSSIMSIHAATTPKSLARNLHNLESLRAIKDLQRQFSHLATFGLYTNISALFAPNGTLQIINPPFPSTSPSQNVTISNSNSTNVNVIGRPAIATWLATDAGAMNGQNPGSMDILICETPLINLAADGMSAKGRWNGIRFQGDGKGGTRMRGGIYENEYTYVGTGAGESGEGEQGWKIEVLRYYALYEGNGAYKDGWRNVGGLSLGRVPYHMTAQEAGMGIPGFYSEEEVEKEAEVEDGDIDVESLERRIEALNAEDSIRNLMHSHGYYTDRRMWSDILDLHSRNTSVTIRAPSPAGGNYTGLSGVRAALSRMGPENLTLGINNDHPIFDTIVEVNENGREALARGIEVGMIGDAKNKTARWEFNVFWNRLVKEDSVWKVGHVDITPLVLADYSKGWGDGGLIAPNTYLPPFLNVSRDRGRGTKPAISLSTLARKTAGVKKQQVNFEDLQRRLSRSYAYDAAENESTAYGYFLDDLDCTRMGALFAKRGHKASPFAGFYITPERITEACFASWGQTNLTAQRSGISFHWRPQPVILVSEDGRSATLRARLLQPNTAKGKAGAFNSAMYHDQMVLEDGVWRLWSVTIDEFYWTSSSWGGGWSNATARNTSEPDPEPAGWTKKYPPDVSIAEVGDREATFRGGSGRYIEWPEIQKMWFQYRNLVSGRTPEYYWPGCVPCRARPDWALEANGYQEPPTGSGVGNWTRLW